MFSRICLNTLSRGARIYGDYSWSQGLRDGLRARQRFDSLREVAHANLGDYAEFRIRILRQCNGFAKEISRLDGVTASFGYTAQQEGGFGISSCACCSMALWSLSYPQLSHISECTLYWLIAVSSSANSWLRTATTLSLPMISILCSQCGQSATPPANTGWCCAPALRSISTFGSYDVYSSLPVARSVVGTGDLAGSLFLAPQIFPITSGRPFCP